MTVRVTTAIDCLAHDPGPGMPERPARLETVLQRLANAGITVDESPLATLEWLATLHDPAYLRDLEAMSARGHGDYGPDCPVGSATWSATLAAAGASRSALDHALAGKGHAFAAVRPPGHHALHAGAMGFCYANQIALLAAEARRQGRDRVLILDWDVHHGNGTQALVEHDPAIRFVSMHQDGWWPGTGLVTERGVGNIFNLPMPPQLPPARYVEALWDGVVAATTGWRPDLVLISAGYDGMAGDPLGGFTLEPEHFADWVARLRSAFSGAPLVALMEGGYLPARLANGVLATVRALA
jgi:acetoin utilization deacetylase AcuC-like enzyme